MPGEHNSIDSAQYNETDLHKLRVNYNLETEPLSTGSKEPNTWFLRTLARMSPRDIHELSWVGLVLWLIVLVLLVGGVVVVLSRGLFLTEFSG